MVPSLSTSLSSCPSVTMHSPLHISPNHNCSSIIDSGLNLSSPYMNHNGAESHLTPLSHSNRDAIADSDPISSSLLCSSRDAIANLDSVSLLYPYLNLGFPSISNLQIRRLSLTSEESSENEREKIRYIYSSQNTNKNSSELVEISADRLKKLEYIEKNLSTIIQMAVAIESLNPTTLPRSTWRNHHRRR